jgi:hypothetical protein
MALSQSLPTPKTSEPFRVVTKVAEGDPGFAFPVPLLPIAPEPLVPEASTPEKLITVREDTTLCDKVAVTVAPVNGEAAKARQISAVPLCTFVRCTRTQVNPPPDTPLTVVLGDEELSAETKASKSSLPDVVLNEGLLMLVPAEDRSADTVASMLTAPWAAAVISKTTVANEWALHNNREFVVTSICPFVFFDWQLHCYGSFSPKNEEERFADGTDESEEGRAIHRPHFGPGDRPAQMNAFSHWICISIAVARVGVAVRSSIGSIDASYSSKRGCRHLQLLGRKTAVSLECRAMVMDER